MGDILKQSCILMDWVTGDGDLWQQVFSIEYVNPPFYPLVTCYPEFNLFHPIFSLIVPLGSFFELLLSLHRWSIMTLVITIFGLSLEISQRTFRDPQCDCSMTSDFSLIFGLTLIDFQCIRFVFIFLLLDFRIR